MKSEQEDPLAKVLQQNASKLSGDQAVLLGRIIEARRKTINELRQTNRLGRAMQAVCEELQAAAEGALKEHVRTWKTFSAQLSSAAEEGDPAMRSFLTKAAESLEIWADETAAIQRKFIARVTLALRKYLRDRSA